MDPAEISSLLATGNSTSVDLDIANEGGVDLNWSMEFFSTASNRGTLDVIWDQPESGTGGIISDEFPRHSSWRCGRSVLQTISIST